jgi:ABC-type molybdate transport system substrate-binding protein
MSSNTPRLRIYSAGAVALPLQEATRLFEENHGVGCRVIPGKPEALLPSIANIREGDVFSAGAEYVLDDVEDRGLVIPGTRQSLGYLRSVTVVPLGNPARIHFLNDLCRDAHWRCLDG